MRTGIHRYFVDRLRNHARMLEYYGNGLSWDGFHLTFDELLNVNILINGRLFPPLSVLFRLAEAALEHARQDPSLHVVGHGDLHGGNIIVRRTGGSTQLLYVDYETVGRHSPWIDIAKPIYNDCFFVYRYADRLGIDLFDLGAVHARVNNDTLDIDFKSSSSRECLFDPLGKALFEVLIEGLLRPFECHLKQQREELSERDLHDCPSLSHALLACALLGRNFSQRPDMFFASLAIGVTDPLC
ncbi:hypothetical protein A0H81_02163 [Grifola frondosa]|uniref:Uncharacterized protein n=1 Tax=Grifola frondosa TaxID=5627 RepID=A0A1C7MTX0_GRIFR|nr:hypothetical protein A0H81_02163 [Grifola frondosa]